MLANLERQYRQMMLPRVLVASLLIQYEKHRSSPSSKTLISAISAEALAEAVALPELTNISASSAIRIVTWSPLCTPLDSAVAVDGRSLSPLARTS